MTDVARLGVGLVRVLVPVADPLRYFLIDEVGGPADVEQIALLQRAADAGTITLTSRLDAELYGNKGALAVRGTPDPDGGVVSMGTGARVGACFTGRPETDRPR